MSLTFTPNGDVVAARPLRADSPPDVVLGLPDELGPPKYLLGPLFEELWSTFVPGVYGDASAQAGTRHGNNGDYWLAGLTLLEDVGTGYVHEAYYSGGTFPWWGTRRDVNDVCLGGQQSTGIAAHPSAVCSGAGVYSTAPTVPILWVFNSLDSGPQADVYYMTADSDTVTAFGFESERRGAYTSNWPPDTYRIGGRDADLTGKIGWIGAGRGDVQSNWPAIRAAIGAVSAGMDRSAISSAFSAVVTVDHAQVLDGRAAADFGGRVSWSGPVFFRKP